MKKEKLNVQSIEKNLFLPSSEMEGLTKTEPPWLSISLSINHK